MVGAESGPAFSTGQLPTTRPLHRCARELLDPGTALTSDSRSLPFCLALQESRQMLLLLPKPGRDWLNEPIHQRGSLVWEGLQRPAGPIGSVVEATAEPLTHTKEEVPSLSLDRGECWKTNVWPSSRLQKCSFPWIRHRLVCFSVTCMTGKITACLLWMVQVSLI